MQKIFHSDPKIGFLALARRFSDAAAQGTVLAPAKSIAEMQRVAFNNYLDAAVCARLRAAGHRDVHLHGDDLREGAAPGPSDGQEIPPRRSAAKGGRMNGW